MAYLRYLKNKINAFFIRSLFAFSLIAIPLVTNAAFWFEQFGANYIFDTAILFINRLITILIGIATLVFFWGVIQYVIAQGDEKKLAEGRKYMFWGIIGLVVIASAWGFVNLITFTIFGQTTFSLPGFINFGGGRGAGDPCYDACIPLPDGTVPGTCSICRTGAGIKDTVKVFKSIGD